METIDDQLKLWRAEATRLREENARLTRALDDAAAMHSTCHKERDEARAEAAHLKECNDGHPTMCCGQCASQIKEAKAEVARLEGLILDWANEHDDNKAILALVAEAKRIRTQREEGR